MPIILKTIYCDKKAAIYYIFRIGTDFFYIYRWKNITFIALAIVIVLISTTWSHSVSSMYRLAHIDTEFSPPIPFKLISTSQYLGILGGEDAKVEFSTLGKNPDSIYVEFKP